MSSIYQCMPRRQLSGMSMIHNIKTYRSTEQAIPFIIRQKAIHSTLVVIGDYLLIKEYQWHGLDVKGKLGVPSSQVG